MANGLIPYQGADPFSELRGLQADMNRLLGGLTATAASHPAVNIYQNDDALLMTAELPGYSEDEIDLIVQDDEITLSANTETNDDNQSGVWHRRERRQANFTRHIELPFRVDPDKVEARLKRGVIEIEVKRPETEKPRRISISS